MCKLIEKFQLITKFTSQPVKIREASILISVITFSEVIKETAHVLWESVLSAVRKKKKNIHPFIHPFNERKIKDPKPYMCF